MFVSVFLSVVLTFVFVFAIAYSATTISTDISTGGSLTLTDGSATITLGNLTVTAGNATIGGTLSVTGVTNMINASTSKELDVAGAFLANNASSTITNLQSVNATISNIASTTKLIVGGDSTNGTVAGIVHGTCAIASAVITASTTKYMNCTSANGVRASDKVFVIPLSIYSNLIVTGASSTLDGTIQVAIFNLGMSTTTSAVVAANNWYWMAIR